MKITGRQRKYRNIYLLLTLVFALTIVSCAASKTHWLNLRADSTVQKTPTTTLTIGVLPFQDNRPPSARIGERILSNGKEEPIRLKSSYPTRDITSVFLQLLKARNIRTVELTDWEPTPGNLKGLPEEVDIAIAGYLDALEVKASSYTFKTEIRYLLKLSAKVGLKAQGRVLSKTLEDRPEQSVIRFRREEVEKTLNEALTSALGRLIDAAIKTK
ncbi:MAG: hypothetical protein PVH15_13360 [Syntrophobacterales bacterium]|jgi:hypothetical protein